jgi:hypothetical protein
MDMQKLSVVWQQIRYSSFSFLVALLLSAIDMTALVDSKFENKIIILTTL